MNGLKAGSMPAGSTYGNLGGCDFGFDDHGTIRCDPNQ